MKTVLVVIAISVTLVISHKPDNPLLEKFSTNTCLPEKEDNEEILEMAITEPELAVIWTETGITGVTTQNVSYVLENDPKCAALLSKYEFWINEKYESSNVNVHIITFHKYNNYYFVIMQYNNSTEYITFGSDAFYILDENLEDIAGYAF